MKITPDLRHAIERAAKRCGMTPEAWARDALEVVIAEERRRGRL